MGNKWIQGAIHKPGALKAKGNTTTARRARLALTLGDMHRHE